MERRRNFCIRPLSGIAVLDSWTLLLLLLFFLFQGVGSPTRVHAAGVGGGVLGRVMIYYGDSVRRAPKARLSGEGRNGRVQGLVFYFTVKKVGSVLGWIGWWKCGLEELACFGMSVQRGGIMVESS